MSEWNREFTDESELDAQADFLNHRRERILDKWGEFGSMDAIKTGVMIYVVTTYSAIEDLSARIIAKYVMDDMFEDAAFDYVYSGMSQYHREELLEECDILSTETRGRIGYFRGLRNTVAHEPFVKFDWYEDEIEERMEASIKVVDILTDAVYHPDWFEEYILEKGDKL